MDEITQTGFTAPAFVPTLNARDYFCRDRYAAEMAAIFEREWIYVGHLSQLPDQGSYLTFDIGDKPILVTRDGEDIIRAFYNVCVHRGHTLAQGEGRAKHFSCPYHSWTYNLDGSLKAAPGVRNLDNLPDCRRSLVQIGASVKDDFIFVRLTPGETTVEGLYGAFFDELRAQLPLLDRLRFAKRFVAEVDGNWKIMVENYLECYHCTPTHPALADLMCIRDFRIVQSEHHLTTRAPAGRPDNKAFAYTVTEDSQREFSGWWIWPNTTFNVFPGQQNLLVFHMLPLSAERSIGYCDYFFIDGIIDEEAQALMDWEGNVLEKEDNDLIVAAHKGMRSGALKNGVFLVDDERHDVSEGPLAHFNMLISRTLSARAPTTRS